ncbi:hypothetical protein ABTB22_19980, partial [Acinetobacter baumannii]
QVRPRPAAHVPLDGTAGAGARDGLLPGAGLGEPLVAQAPPAKPRCELRGRAPRPLAAARRGRGAGRRGLPHPHRAGRAG